MSEQGQAFMVTRRALKELSDGTLRVQFDVEPNDKSGFLQMFPDIGLPMVVVRLQDEVVKASQTAKTARPYSSQAQELYKGGFLRNVSVCKALGTDRQFLDWLKGQACVITGQVSTEYESVVPAHVRLVSQGSGTGIKPEFTALPLVNRLHQLQHDKGYSAVHKDGIEWFEKQAFQYRALWCKERLKKALRADSLTELDPADLAVWAREHDVFHLLPAVYREAT